MDELFASFKAMFGEVPKWVEGSGLMAFLFIAYKFFDRSKQSQNEAAQTNLALQTHHDDSERKDFEMVKQSYIETIEGLRVELERTKKLLFESYDREEALRERLRNTERKP